jgi:hypothetical protein
VLQELRLSATQLRKLQELQAQQQASMRRMAGAWPDLLRKDPAGLAREWEEVSRTAEKAVGEILTARQYGRLLEISRQQRGGLALGDPEVAEALRLTEAQRQKVQAIQADAVKELQDLALKLMTDLAGNSPGVVDFQKALEMMGQAQRSFVELGKQYEEIRKRTGEKLLGELTTEQAARWKELTGKPFRGRGP